MDWLVILGALGAVLMLFMLVRAGKLREKYIVLWALVGGTVLVLSMFPVLLDHAANLLGFAVPANLLFLLTLLLLLGVTLHQSLELTKQEDKTRDLAEQVAILDTELRKLQDTLNTQK